MKLHSAFLGQGETSNSSKPGWSHSNGCCRGEPFGKYASSKLMLLPGGFCHLVTKGVSAETEKTQNLKAEKGK